LIITLGIDPSLTATGYCRMIDGTTTTWGEWKTKEKGLPRLSWLNHMIREELLSSDYALVCIEGYAFARPNQAHQLGELGGVLRLQLYYRDNPWLEIAPAALKKFATGKGNADKEQIMLQVYKRWGFEAESNNVADAYVLAKIAYHLASGNSDGLTDYQQEVLYKPQEALANES
jgi:crossover junction endodeoxyribonuclease RuvC